MLKTFLSANLWLPLSRLSYMVYLIFGVIDATLMASMNQAFYLSYMNLIALVNFNFVFCYVASFLCHIFFEAPLVNLIFAR